MSYCVNCGVELDSTASKCVLCGCPVVNPFAQKSDTSAEIKPYPDKIVIPKATRKSFTALIVSVVMLIPCIVCGLTNFFTIESGDWSFYVISSVFLAWVLFVLPFLPKKKHPYIMLAVDTVELLLYLFFIFAMNIDDGELWFLKFALPLVLALSGIVLFMFLWLGKKRRSPFKIVIAVLTQISLYCIIIDILLHLFYTIHTQIYFSFIVTVSCLVLIALMIFALKNKRFGAWMRRKFFV